MAELDEDLALTLKYYIDEKEPPKIAFAFCNQFLPLQYLQKLIRSPLSIPTLKMPERKSV